jgi:hypothetical protein
VRHTLAHELGHVILHTGIVHRPSAPRSLEEWAFWVSQAIHHETGLKLAKNQELLNFRGFYFAFRKWGFDMCNCAAGGSCECCLARKKIGMGRLINLDVTPAHFFAGARLSGLAQMRSRCVAKSQQLRASKDVPARHRS